MRSSGAIVSTAVLMEKAQQLAIQFNETFVPSAGWLWRWQNLQGIKVRKVHGEGQSADFEAGENYKAAVKEKIAKFDSADILNADETGLFYKAMPSSTLTRLDTDMRGVKSPKERLTILFLCNATGDFKRLYVVGKHRNPRCFIRKHIPVKYYWNKKAWMTQEIWKDILNNLNADMVKLNKFIILFVDNAAVHTKINELSNIAVEFFPPNTTSITQPLDQGIIHCFKAYYRKSIVRKQLAAVESGKTSAEFIRSIHVLKALHIIKHSWWLVQPSCITNCFKKAGLFKGEENLVTPEEIDEVFIVDEGFHADFGDFINCDNNLQCYGLLTDEEIVNEVLQEDTDDEEEDIIAPSKTITFQDLLQGIDNLQQHFQAENKFMMELEHMQAHIVRYKVEGKIQTKITEFYQKN